VGIVGRDALGVLGAKLVFEILDWKRIATGSHQKSTEIGRENQQLAPGRIGIQNFFISLEKDVDVILDCSD
jgi:hypothetical protein